MYVFTLLRKKEIRIDTHIINKYAGEAGGGGWEESFFCSPDDSIVNAL